MLIILSNPVWPGATSPLGSLALDNPAIFCIPIGFLGCFLGTKLSSEQRQRPPVRRALRALGDRPRGRGGRATATRRSRGARTERGAGARRDAVSADVVELTRELVAIRTVNPPGDEEKAASLLAARLEAAGFAVDLARVRARAGRRSSRALAGRRPVAVPDRATSTPCRWGAPDWSVDPFSGETDGDRLFGRGTSDMKGGTAAIVVAAERLAALGAVALGGLELVLCAGEETGCEGALALAATTARWARCGAVLVAEPTTNYPCVAHKGVVWADAVARGKTAHGSMPHLGENADLQARAGRRSARGLRASTAASTRCSARPTVSLGTFSGGHQHQLGARPRDGGDRRPHRAGAVRRRRARGAAGTARRRGSSSRRAWRSTRSTPTRPATGCRTVFAVMGPLIGETPGAARARLLHRRRRAVARLRHPPTIICGPGDAEQAHRTDESCSMAALEAAGEGFFEIAKRWCGL